MTDPSPFPAVAATAALLLLLAACVEMTVVTTSTGVTTTIPTTVLSEPIEPETPLRSAPCNTSANPTTIAAIAAPDPRTVVFRLCRPDGAFLSKLAYPTMTIQPSEHLIASNGAPLDRPIGTGSYRFLDWHQEDGVTLERFEDYWGERPHTDRIVFRWFVDTVTRETAIEAGEIDVMAVTDEDLSDLADRFDFERVDFAELNVVYLGINRDVEALADPRVRTAIAAAVDKQTIVDDLFPDGTSAAAQFLPPGVPGYPAAAGSPGFDPEAAAELLDNLGLEDLQLDLAFRDAPSRYLPDPAAVAEMIENDLAAVGIDVVLRPLESAEFLRALDAGELALYLMGWEAAYPDATEFLDFHFGTNASRQFGEHYPAIESLLTDAAITADQATRNDLYRQAAILLGEEVPAVPIAHSGGQLARQVDVTGLAISPIGTDPLWAVDPGPRDVLGWMQPAAPSSLYCADESDRDTFRICHQMLETLITYDFEANELRPLLAESYKVDAAGTTWTFQLRDGVSFHDGTTFDSEDVFASFVAQWDDSSPLHTGRSGAFVYFAIMFGGFLSEAG
jgi:ABC-type transport system substrate-binding protein